jgi:hypothetical protein
MDDPMTDPIAKPNDPAVIALRAYLMDTFAFEDPPKTHMLQRMADIVRAPLIARLTDDAHNETGSVREYARSLLADLGHPLPPDPERGTPTGRAPWPFANDDAEPFNLAPSVQKLRSFPAAFPGTCAHGDDAIYPEQMIRWVASGRYSHVECIPNGDADDE